jgi:hypothetical protein
MYKSNFGIVKVTFHSNVGRTAKELESPRSKLLTPQAINESQKAHLATR